MPTLKYDSDIPVEYVPIQAIAVPATTSGQPILAGDSLLCGYSIKESTGTAPAEFQIYDGSSNNGQLVLDVTLLAGQSVVEELPFPGVYLGNGMQLVVTVGSVSGAIWVRDV